MKHWLIFSFFYWLLVFLGLPLSPISIPSIAKKVSSTKGPSENFEATLRGKEKGHLYSTLLSSRRSAKCFAQIVIFNLLANQQTMADMPAFSFHIWRNPCSETLNTTKAEKLVLNLGFVKTQNSSVNRCFGLFSISCFWRLIPCGLLIIYQQLRQF